MDKLTEIEARLGLITPKPWDSAGSRVYAQGSGATVCKCFSGLGFADARFIAHSPEDIAWLINEVKRLRGV